MAQRLEPYNRQTLQLFEKPVHAGDLQGDYTDVARGDATESAGGARIQIAVGLHGDEIKECRFRVFGCPHLIAASEWLCSQYEGSPVAELVRFQVADCIQSLAVPVEKTGRLLLLEDAIRSLAVQLRADATV